MKKGLLYVLIGVLCILQILSLVKINSLSYEMNSLRNSYAASVSELRSQIAGISSNIEESLREQARLTENVSYEYGLLNCETHTVPITITVIPKTVTNETEVSLGLGDENIPLVRVSDVVFRAVLDVDLFEKYGDPVFRFCEPDRIQTEAADGLSLSELWRVFLPGFYADFPVSFRYTEKTGTLSVNGYVVWHSYTKSDDGSSFVRFRLVTIKNGEVVANEDVTSAVTSESSWSDAMMSEIPFNKEYKVADGDRIEIYAVAEDEYGYRHECFVEKIQIENDEVVSCEIITDKTIYDREGNVMWPNPIK